MSHWIRGHSQVGMSDVASNTDSADECPEADAAGIDLKGEQTASNLNTQLLNLDYKDLWALALTTALGGHYLPWSLGLTAGFGSYIIAAFLTASAYVCLMLCSAELSSALPFAGGAYGTARVTLGIFPGYLVACADSLKSVLFTTSAASTIGRMITISAGGEERWEPLYWLVFYTVSLSLHCYGGRTLWRSFAALSIVAFLLLLVYLLGSIPYTDLPEHAPFPDQESETDYDRWFHGGMYEFMHALPYPSWFFIGIQNINLACGEMRNPKTDVPRGYLAAITTVAFTSFSAILVAVSIHPGISLVKVRNQPLNRGYEKMFSISERHATVLSLPATISSGFGFMFFYGRQLRAMGESGLLNPVFARELPGRHTPIGALMLGSLLGYGLCLLTFYVPILHAPLNNFSKLCAYATYLSILLSYWVFRSHFPNIMREFVSPLGKAGALYGMAVFGLSFISIAAFQDTSYVVVVFAVVILIATAYYYLVVEKRQVFSEEEKTVMFKAYLVKGNAAKKTRLKRGFGAVTKKRAAMRIEVQAQGSSTFSAAALTSTACGGMPTAESAATLPLSEKTYERVQE